MPLSEQSGQLHSVAKTRRKGATVKIKSQPPIRDRIQDADLPSSSRFDAGFVGKCSSVFKQQFFRVAVRVTALVTMFTVSANLIVPARTDTGAARKAYNFEKITDGIYYATGTGSMLTGGNHPIIINDRDVLLVDDGNTPAVGRELLRELKRITDKPVRWVVDSHYHWDHTDGNQIFGPDVQIIAHESVRSAILGHDFLHTEPYKTSIGSVPQQIENMKRQLAGEKDPAKRSALSRQIAALQTELAQIEELKLTPPTMTYSSKLTIYDGGREIDLLFLGRGHTEGDTVVFLPKERIVCSGDLMESRPAYMGDGIFDEWITSLDALKKLDFDTVLPGHGVPFHGKELITEYQSYLRDLIGQVAALRRKGLSADDAAQKVDLTAHRSAFPDITGPGADVRGVRRVYQWMDEKGLH
jgi:glyoxylase-like metal-dependent hydrolase (beta-lactamase superfamily II)